MKMFLQPKSSLTVKTKLQSQDCKTKLQKKNVTKLIKKLVEYDK